MQITEAELSEARHRADVEIAKRQLAFMFFKHFVLYVKEGYEMEWFHELICNKLQDFADGKIKKLMINLPPQHGKACSNSTPVLTVDGWKTHGELNIGDYVFGRNGKPVMVEAVSKDCMTSEDVYFSDGSIIQCHANHEWLVYDDKLGKSVTVDTKTIKANVFYNKNNLGKIRFYVDRLNPIAFGKKKLPIHPYLFAIYLKHRNKKTGELMLSENKTMRLALLSKDITSGIHRLKEDAQKIKFDANKIPEIYHQSSKEQRLLLLAGLIDFSGYVKGGKAHVVSKDKDFIVEVRRLLSSLGISYGMKNNQFNTENNLDISIKATSDLPLLGSVERNSLTVFENTIRGVVSVVSSRKQQAGRCIQVEGGIYLVGDNLIPTHNSELATRLFAPFILGKNPNKKIAITSYSANITDKLNREIQRYFEEIKYKNIFPNTRLSSGSKEESVYQRNLEVLDIIDATNSRSNGFIKTVGIGGSLTGTPVDIGIIDDPIKDFEEAQSPTVRQKAWDWYESVFETRLHNHSQILMIMTRWDEDDPAGRVLAKEGDEWEIIKLPAIKENDQNEYDNRKTGQVLWENRHSLDRMLKKQTTSPIIFNALYQQNPQPSKDILVFPDWSEIDKFPDIPFYYTIDYGFQNDPTALVKMGDDKKEGMKICYVHEMIYETKLTSPDLAIKLRALGITKEIIYVDRNASECIAILRKAKFNVIPTRKGQGSIVAGISKVKEFRIYYTSSSNNIRKEKSNYSYIVSGNKPTNEPIDKFNHSIDAIRGALFTRFGRGRTGQKRGVRRAN
jgi:hypothetical protein